MYKLLKTITKVMISLPLLCLFIPLFLIVSLSLCLLCPLLKVLVWCLSKDKIDFSNENINKGKEYSMYMGISNGDCDKGLRRLIF
jgi:hypothetical protein